MGVELFYDCDMLKSVSLGTGITEIPESMFEHCDALDGIIISYRVTDIKNKAFKDCQLLRSVTIPRATTYISDNAFSYYDKLTIYGLADSYAEEYAGAKGIKFVNLQVNANKVTLSDTELTLKEGSTYTLSMTVDPENFTDNVVWKSSDTSVVTVTENGTVEGVSTGTATIKLTVGSESASCKVTVIQPVTWVDISEREVTLNTKDTFQLTATAYPDTAYDRSITWSTSDPTVATVDGNGLVTALKKGKTVIKAAANDGSGEYAACTVTVSGDVITASSVDDLESPHDYSSNCSDVWLYQIAGAEKLTVTFDERTSFESGFDFLYIYDRDGKEIGEYTGTELAGRSIDIPGDTIKIKLVSDGEGTEWGFKVVSITSGSTPPPTPVQLKTPVLGTASNTVSGVKVTWKKSSGAKKYRIYRKTGSGSWGKLKDVGNVNSYTDTTVVSGKKYTYTVRCLSEDGKSTVSSYDAKGKSVTYYAAPKLGRAANAINGVTITWTKSNGAKKYRIYRKTGSGSLTKLADVGNVAKYTDTKAASGKTYTYTVQCINASGKAISAYNTKGLKIAYIAAPKLMSVKNTAAGKVTVTWTKSAGVKKYRILRKTAGGKWAKLADVGNVASYVDKKAKKNKTYYYTVRCLSADGRSYLGAYNTTGKAVKVRK